MVRKPAIKIRFWGVDTPESRSNGRWPNQPFSEEAANFVKGMIEDEVVMVRMTGETTYSRHVGEIFVDGRSVSRELVRNGLAHWYASFAQYDTDLRRLQDKAKQSRAGLWSQENVIDPGTWRNGMDHNCANRDNC